MSIHPLQDGRANGKTRHRMPATVLEISPMQTAATVLILGASAATTSAVVQNEAVAVVWVFWFLGKKSGKSKARHHMTERGHDAQFR